MIVLRDGGGYYKAIRVGRLRELLAALPDEYWISCNDVRNLAVLRDDGTIPSGRRPGTSTSPRRPTNRSTRSRPRR